MVEGHCNRWMWIAVLLASACLFAACQEGEGVSDEGLVLEILGGADQTGAAGRDLPEMLRVRAVRAGGIPLALARVRFAVEAGGGVLSASSVLTNENGEAFVSWTLGPAPVRNRVSARLSGAEVLFQARAEPGAAPEPELVFEGPAGTSSEDLAFRAGRGLLLGTKGGLLQLPAPGEKAVKVPITGEPIEQPVGIAFGRNGNLYVCENAAPPDGAALKQVTPAGACRTLSAGFQGEPFALPNYAAVHSSGEILLTATCDNRIYRISPRDGATSEFLSIPGPNGIAFNADESFLYILTENPLIFCGGQDAPGGLHRVAVDSDLQPGAIETLVPDFALAGDGLAFDAEGNLFVVFSGILEGGSLERLLTSGIFVYTPDGRFHEFVSVDLPMDIFTNIAFGIPPFDPLSLYAYGFTGRLYRIRVGIPGLGLPGTG